MIVFIEDMFVRAHHGVLPQERVVGADFLVSVRVDAEVSAAATVDDRLEGTVSYADLAADVHEVMAVASNLLENVAMRLSQTILSRHDRVKKVWVRIVKKTPPMNAEMAAAGVEMTLER